MYRLFDSRWLKHIDFLILDSLALLLSFLFSSMFRTVKNFDFTFRVSFLLLVLNVFVAFFDENYHGVLKRGYLQELKKSGAHVFFILILLILYLYFVESVVRVSVRFFSVLFALSWTAVWGLRCGYKALRRRSLNRLKQAGGKSERLYQLVLLAVQDDIGEILKNLQGSDVYVRGICLAGGPGPREIEGIPVVADMEDLPDYIKNNVVDGLLVSLPRGMELPERLRDACLSMGVPIHKVLGWYSSAEGDQVVERMGSYAVLTQSIRIVKARQLFLKRLVDICAGVVGVVVTGLCFLFVAPAIYRKSPGPVFFSQIRVGKNGRKFRIYKFRSMYMDAEKRKQELMEQNKIKDGMMFKIDNDPRIIPGIGNFIRDYSIDELPQFWNVLKGEMSLIGTRPPTVEEYEKYDYHHKRRLAIKPGITGMWQVSGRSNVTDFEQVVALDTRYIADWSLELDLKILLRTMKVVLLKRGAM